MILYTTLHNGKIIDYNNALYYGNNITQIATNNQINSLQSQITNNNNNLQNQINNKIIYFNGTKSYTSVADSSITLYTFPDNCKYGFFIAYVNGSITQSTNGLSAGVFIKCNNNTLFSSIDRSAVVTFNYYPATLPYFYVNGLQYYAIYENYNYIGTEKAFINSTKYPFILEISVNSNTTNVNVQCSYYGYYFTFWQNFKFSIFATYF